MDLVVCVQQRDNILCDLFGWVNRALELTCMMMFMSRKSSTFGEKQWLRTLAFFEDLIMTWVPALISSFPRLG